MAHLRAGRGDQRLFARAARHGAGAQVGDERPRSPDGHGARLDRIHIGKAGQAFGDRLRRQCRQGPPAMWRRPVRRTEAAPACRRAPPLRGSGRRPRQISSAARRSSWIARRRAAPAISPRRPRHSAASPGTSATCSGATMLVPTCFDVPAMQAYMVLISRSCPVSMSRAVIGRWIEMDVLAQIDDAGAVIEIGEH